jgi:hypothetical protein
VSASWGGTRESHKMPPAASSAPETIIGRVPVLTNIFVATVEPNPMPTLTGRYESPDRSFQTSRKRPVVITIAGDRVGVVTGFAASVMPRFGLPRTLPETE